MDLPTSEPATTPAPVDGAPDADTRGGFSAGRIIAIVASVLLGLPLVVLLYTVVSSALSWDPGVDPHGYLLIFGTVVCVVLGLGLLCVLPFALPRRWRTRLLVVALIYAGALVALALAALITTLF